MGSQLKLQGISFSVLVSEMQDVRSMDQLDSITRIKVFGGDTLFESVESSSNIKNGVVATSISFLSDATSGIISSNLSLPKMETNTISQIFFIAPKWQNQVGEVQMNTQGSIWAPKVFFDNDKIYKMIQEKLSKKNAA